MTVTTTSKPVAGLNRSDAPRGASDVERTHPAYQQARGFTLPLAPLNGGRKRHIAPQP